MAKTTVRVEHSGTNLSLHFAGAHLANANADLVTECLNTLFACAEKNNCFEKGLTAACLGTIAEHNAKVQCISKAFGFGAK